MEQASTDFSSEDGGAFINALPPGLLETFFGHIAPQHLRNIVSFVCKRWRRVALRCMTELVLAKKRALWEPTAPHMLAQLSWLISVSITVSERAPLPHQCIFPPSMTSLRFNARCPTDVLTKFSYPPLKKLDLPYVNEQHLATLLDHSLSSLESLSLGGNTERVPDEPLIAVLNDRTLPALTSLSLFAVWSRPSLLPFLARHASRLTSLALEYFEEDGNEFEHLDDIAAMPFTRLHALTLVETLPFTAKQLADLLQGATQLTALTVSLCPQVLELPPRLLTSLVAFTATTTASNEADALSSLPRLRQIDLFNGSERLDSWFALGDALLSKFSVVRLLAPADSSPDRLQALLVKTYNVHILVIDLRHTLAPLPPDLCFPHLQKVMLLTRDCPRSTPAELLRGMADFVRRAPRLSEFTVTLAPSTQGDIAILCDLVHDLMRRGCCVTVGGLSEEARIAVDGACKNPWGSLRHT